MARSVELEQTLRVRILLIQLAMILIIAASTVTAFGALGSREATARRFARWSLVVSAIAGMALAVGTIMTVRRVARLQDGERRGRELATRRQQALEHASDELQGQLRRVNTLVERGRSAMEPELAQRFDVETARLENVVRRVLAGTTAAQATPRLHRTSVELEALFARVLEGAKPTADWHGRRLVAYVQHPLPTLSVDERRLAESLSALLERALAEHAGEEVVMRVGVCEGGVRVEVDGVSTPPLELVALIEAHGGVVGVHRVPKLAAWLMLPVEPALLSE